MAQVAALSIISARSGLARYFEQIRRFPLLEPQEEFMLAKRWLERGDRDAGHRLVTSHLVAKIATGYRGYGLPAAEIIAEGNLGLMKAVRRFDPEKASVSPLMPCGGSGHRFRNTCCARGRW